MSAVGRKLWLHMQETTPPFNRKAVASALSASGVYPTTPQSISNYLYREHPPVAFVNAMVDLLRLAEDDEAELHWLYFRGETDQTDDERLTEKSRSRITEIRGRWAEQNEAERSRRGSDSSTSRVSGSG